MSAEYVDVISILLILTLSALGLVVFQKHFWIGTMCYPQNDKSQDQFRLLCAFEKSCTKSEVMSNCSLWLWLSAHESGLCLSRYSQCDHFDVNKTANQELKLSYKVLSSS